MRYFGDNDSGDKTGVEIIGNPDTGTITILEFIPSTSSTCFISMGRVWRLRYSSFSTNRKDVDNKTS